MPAHWIPMQAHHLSVVDEIAQVVHPNYPERPEVMADRLMVFPQGCFVAVTGDDQAPTMIGYTLVHPGVLLRPPALDSLLDVIPQGANCLYLHDVALLPASRGLGLGKSLVEILKKVAREWGWSTIALTAVNGSVPYWLANGFHCVDPDEALAKKLASYDDDAAYMVLST